MRIRRLCLTLTLLTPVLLLATQQPVTVTPQAAQLLQRSLAALIGNQKITDVTFTGSVHRIAGSDDETGTAVLTALAADASRIDLNLSSGPRSEIQNNSGTSSVGSWSGTDGVAHPMSLHNLFTDSTWFFPSFSIAHRLSSTYSATFIGEEMRNGQSVQRVTVSQASGIQTPAGTPAMAHLTQMDFLLDSTTFLPAAIAYNIHPDNDITVDIPVEIRFSDYRVINGVQVPFHVQRFLNNSLALDLQFQNAALNSGLTTTNFSVAVSQ